ASSLKYTAQHVNGVSPFTRSNVMPGRSPCGLGLMFFGLSPNDPSLAAFSMTLNALSGSATTSILASMRATINLAPPSASFGQNKYRLSSYRSSPGSSGYLDAIRSRGAYFGLSTIWPTSSGVPPGWTTTALNNSSASAAFISAGPPPPRTPPPPLAPPTPPDPPPPPPS